MTPHPPHPGRRFLGSICKNRLIFHAAMASDYVEKNSAEIDKKWPSKGVFSDIDLLTLTLAPGGDIPHPKSSLSSTHPREAVYQV